MDFKIVAIVLFTIMCTILATVDFIGFRTAKDACTTHGVTKIGGHNFAVTLLSDQEYNKSKR